jgi:hypothetical protein
VTMLENSKLRCEVYRRGDGAVVHALDRGCEVGETGSRWMNEGVLSQSSRHRKLNTQKAGTFTKWSKQLRPQDSSSVVVVVS